MSLKEFANLKPGDTCVVSRGVNKNRAVIVEQIFGKFVTVKTGER